MSNKAFIAVLVLLSLFINKEGFSQSSLAAPQQQYLKLNKEYFRSCLTDAGKIAVAPLHWNGRQWAGFAGVAGATGLAYWQDETIRDYFQRNRTEAKDNIAKYGIAPLGTYYLVPIIGGMYLYGVAAKNAGAETAGLLAGEAVILTGAYTMLFKMIFQRQRPSEGNPPDPDNWEGPLGGFRHGSFPSGHTALAFATAATISTYYHDKKWVGIVSYTLAALVGVSRVYSDDHWASDVVAGAALGYSIGRLVTHRQQTSQTVSINPYSNGFATGISFTVNL